MKAAELGLTPQAYVDEAHQPFKTMAERVGASYTDFIRTTDVHHAAAVQYIWQQLKPHIYKDKYEGWYCTGCEQFYTDKEVEITGGKCPNHQKEYEHLSEENYYLRASDFTEQIRTAIETNKLKIVPEFRKNEILDLISGGVKDVSISRPKKSLSWGVPVPDDPEQVMYVWVDALSNYITVLGYPDQETWRDFGLPICRWWAKTSCVFMRLFGQQFCSASVLDYRGRFWRMGLSMLVAPRFPKPLVILSIQMSS